MTELPSTSTGEMEDDFIGLHIGPSMSLNRVDEILAEHLDKSKFSITWEKTPVRWDSQTEAKRFWFTLLKVVHVNDKPKILKCCFPLTRDVYASSPTPDWSFVANHVQETKCKTIKSLILKNIPFRNGPDWSVLTRECKIEHLEPYYFVKYGVKYGLTNNGRYDYVGNASKWENFNGFDFCSEIKADCVKLQGAEGIATVKPSDFENCTKLIIEAGDYDSFTPSPEGPTEGYEYDMEFIETCNHPNTHLHLYKPFSIIDHPGKHDNNRVWKIADVEKFIDRIQSSSVKIITYPSLTNEIDRYNHPEREEEKVDKVFDCTSSQLKTDFMDFYKTQPRFRGWSGNVFYTSRDAMRDYYEAFRRGEACDTYE